MTPGWLTLPRWGASVGVGRGQAHRLLPRIPDGAKRFTADGWLIREGTPKPKPLRAGRPRKPG